MNYKALQDLAAYYLKRRDVESIYPQIQELTNARIGADAALIVMETELELAFTVEPTLALPGDFARFKTVLSTCRGDTVRLNVYSQGQLANLVSSTQRSGCPVGYAVYAGVIEVAPFTEDRILQSTYYAIPALMVGETDTNSVLDRWPTLYLFAFLSYCANALQDIDLQNVYGQQYLGELQAANESEAFASMSGGAPRFQE